MRVIFILIFSLFFLLSGVLLFAEMQTALTLINNTFATRVLEHDVLELEDGWIYGGDFDAHIMVNPGMIFQENFQADALLDVCFLKPYNNAEFNMNIKQAFVDLLFFDFISLKTGFILTDYGFNNNYFHPMDVGEFFPQFRTLYPDIYTGANNLGMPGVPSARLNVSFLDIIPGINISLDQGLVWYDFENIDHNFFLSSLSLMSSNFQAGVVLGYSQGILPVLGMNASITFPFNTIMLWEGVLRQESFRAYVDDDLIQEYRERLFFNQSVRLETTQKEPLFQNSISCYAEYFYYDEGFSKAQFNNIYDYLETQDINVLLIPEYYDLIIPERNFRHYLTLGTGYVTQENWSFLYKSIAELTNGIWQHWFTIGKAFDNVMIGLSVIYIPPLAKKYQLIYGARDLLFYFQISMEL